MEWITNGDLRSTEGVFEWIIKDNKRKRDKHICHVCPKVFSLPKDPSSSKMCEHLNTKCYSFCCIFKCYYVLILPSLVVRTKSLELSRQGYHSYDNVFPRRYGGSESEFYSSFSPNEEINPLSKLHIVTKDYILMMI